MIRFAACLIITLTLVTYTAFTAVAATPEKILNVVAVKAPAGVEAWLVEDKSVPVISIAFSFEGGLANDPEDKPGVGRLVSMLLDEGAGKLKSQAFQQKLSDNAIQLSFTAGRDHFTGRLKTLRANKDLAIELTALALTAPRFDKDAIERMKQANSAEIRQNMGDGSWLAARTFNGMVFENHFYAAPGYGDLQSMQSITRGDLIDFADTQLRRGALRVAIAGDISAAEAEATLSALFGKLPLAEETADTPQPATLSYAGKTILLPLDTPQTFILAGDGGVAHTDPDWPAAVVMNYILGGGQFDSRLMKEIRVKRGLTYGVYSMLTSMKYASMLQASFSAGNAKAAEAVSILRREWASLAEKGPTPEEVSNAKAYLTGSILLDLTSTSDIAGALNALQQDGLDIDYVNNQNALINAVTPDDVKRVATRLLKPDNLTIVMVGKPVDVSPDVLLDQPPGLRNGDDK